MHKIKLNGQCIGFDKKNRKYKTTFCLFSIFQANKQKDKMKELPETFLNVILQSKKKNTEERAFKGLPNSNQG